MKAYLHTFGCKVNQYDSQSLMESLNNAGYSYTGDIKEADLILINSCTVTAEADRQCRQLIRKTLKENGDARVIITGCYSSREQVEIKAISAKIEILPKGIDILNYLGHASIKGNNNGITKFDEHSRVFVKIQDGCNAFCSYCIVPYVRPVLESKPEKTVLSEIQRLVDSGYPEVVLTGVRLGLYEGGILDLLKKIVQLKGDFRVRLSSLSVNHIDNALLEFVRSHQDKICPHFHIPLQSGSENILKAMKRQYTAGFFEATVSNIYAFMPEAGVSTDVIVGFPGEKDEDFRSTYDVMRRLELSRLHVFRFSNRPGTIASTLGGQVNPSVIKERSQVLKKLDEELQAGFWRRFTGTCRKVVEEKNKNSALTDNYIRLGFDRPWDHKKNNLIFNVKIVDRQGKPWGVEV